MHVTIPSSPFFYVIGAISKESIWRSAAQPATKRLCVETTNAAPTPRPSSSSAPFPSLGEMSLSLYRPAYADFGSRFDHIFNEMC